MFFDKKGRSVDQGKEIENLQSRADVLARDKSKLTQEIILLKASIKTANTNHHAQILSLKTQLRNAKGESVVNFSKKTSSEGLNNKFSSTVITEDPDAAAGSNVRKLEKQVADLTKELEDAARAANARALEKRRDSDLWTGILARKDRLIQARNDDIDRLKQQVEDMSELRRLKVADVERQLQQMREEKASVEQRLTEQATARRAAEQRLADQAGDPSSMVPASEVNELKLQRNQQATELAAAQREAERLRGELARRDEQLEYYQQRLVAATGFKGSQTPLESEEA